MKKIINYLNEKSVLNNIVYIPDKADTDISEFPLLVYLHGAGERGNNLNHLSRHAVPRLVDSGRQYSAVILCPQCPADAVWDNIPEKTKRTIDITAKKYNIKSDRIVLTGSSMGGFGLVMMGMTYRNFFAGIAVVSGGGMSWRSQNLSDTPMLFFHGDKDDAVPIECSLMLFNELKKKGFNAEIKIFKNSGHNDAIEKAYEEPYLIDWLISQRRLNYDYVPETLEELF